MIPLIIIFWGYTYWATPDMFLNDIRSWIIKTTPLLLALLIGIGGCFFIFHEHLNPLIYLMVLFNIGLFLSITFIEIGFFRVLKKVFDNWVIFVFMLLFMFVFNYWLESKKIIAEITKMWHVNARGQSQHNGPFICLFRFIIEDITFLLFAFWVFFYNTFPWSIMRFLHPVMCRQTSSNNGACRFYGFCYL